MSIENNSTIEQSGNMPKGGEQSIPKGWVETTLGEVVSKIIDYRGKTPKKLGENWSINGKYRALSAKSVKTGGLTNLDQINRVNEILYKKWMKDEIQLNDILMTSEAPMGEVLLWKTDEKIVLSQRLFALRAKDDVSPNYLYYYFISRKFEFELKARASGTTVVGIRQTELKKTKIVIPPLLEQKAIAQILTAFDDKIELLQTQNKTLETTAQTIFKEWFGKYQIGDELPEGWRVGKLGEEFNITIGRTPPRKEKEWFSNTPIGKKWISIKDIGNSGAYISNTAEYLTNKAIERFNIPIIPKNTTILSFKMTVGKLTITTEDMLSNEAIAHLKLKQNTVLSSEFIYLYLQDLDFNALGSTSSIVTAINSTMIKYLEFLMPEKNILLQFDELIKPIFDKIYNNTTQIQTLKQTRDTLLPKLMSGQLRVDEFKEGAI
jgi:type I restriction enzyme S subunit